MPPREEYHNAAPRAFFLAGLTPDEMRHAFVSMPLAAGIADVRWHEKAAFLRRPFCGDADDIGAARSRFFACFHIRRWR